MKIFIFIILQVVMKSVSKTTEFLKTMPQKIVPKDYGGLAPIMMETNGKFRFYKYYACQIFC